MKKQFFRVKQLADQTFSRAGKTEVLSDDLQEADRKVEYIKNSCQNVGKKISACLLLGQLQGESGTKEKLMKKSPSYQLGATMLECGSSCDDESLMKTVLNKCGQAEKTLSEESVEHDHRIEQHVIAPLQSVLETEIPNIIKQKRNVTKVCLDMDSAKARYQQAQKHSSHTGGAAKIESIKEELKDCEQKVEQTRDILASEMFHLAARESQLCYTILQYYKFQKHFHEYALGVLDRLIPELENDICSSRTKPVYGVDLEEHLQVTGRKIAFPIELCVCALLELGMEEEGLFRLAGGASKLKRMKLSFDAGCMTLATALAYRDPHVIAGALKSYLRELPEPLLTHSLYDEWLNAAKAQTHPDNKLQALWTVVHKLPKANFDNLSYLIKFFHVLSKNHEVNKMSPHNIAIVIAPSLIWTKEENNGTGFGLNVNVSLYPSIIDLLVTYADWFFDKDMDFYMTLEPVVNGELDETKSSSEKGIDNKGFDPKVADKMQRSGIEKASGQNHPGGDIDANSSNIRRSQSINSLSEEGGHSYDSPRPIMRRKNKSVAPGPPVFKEDKKKEEKAGTTRTGVQVVRAKEFQVQDRPDKPPRPSVASNATLPRPSKSKSGEANEEEIKLEANDDIVLLRKSQMDVSVSRTSIFTNTESSTNSGDKDRTDFLEKRPVAAPRMSLETAEKPIEYSKVNLISVKKEWLLGKDSVENENVTMKKPAVPERPSALKPQNFKFSRSSLFGATVRNNYENVPLTLASNEEELSCDERTSQKNQLYSMEKQKVCVVEVESTNKKSISKLWTGDDEVEEIPKKSDGSLKDGSSSSDDDGDIVLVEERKTVTPNPNRPLSMPGTEKPERPPKPDYKLSPSSSSHTRTFSDGQIIEINTGDRISGGQNNVVNGQPVKISSSGSGETGNQGSAQTPSSSSPPTCVVIKHPQTSPPPPPVPAKPRTGSQSESIDFCEKL